MQRIMILLAFFCLAQQLAEAEKEERMLRWDGDFKRVKLTEGLDLAYLLLLCTGVG